MFGSFGFDASDHNRTHDNYQIAFRQHIKAPELPSPDKKPRRSKTANGSFRQTVQQYAKRNDGELCKK